LLIIHWLTNLPWPLWITSLGIFAVAWIGQFIGHAIEGKRPSFFKDLQFLLIGPLWCWRRLTAGSGCLINRLKWPTAISAASLVAVWVREQKAWLLLATQHAGCASDRLSCRLAHGRRNALVYALVQRIRDPLLDVCLAVDGMR